MRRRVDRAADVPSSAGPPLRDRERPAGDLADQARGPGRPLRDRRRRGQRLLPGPRARSTSSTPRTGRELIERHLDGADEDALVGAAESRLSRQLAPARRRLAQVSSSRGGEAGTAAAQAPVRWLDRAIGILLGLVLGDRGDRRSSYSRAARTRSTRHGSPASEPVPQEPAAEQGAAPRAPAAAPSDRHGQGGGGRAAGERPGPARVSTRSTARFRVVSDAPVTIDVLGYGISEPVESGDVISFPATRVGQFPVVVAGSNIGVATLECNDGLAADRARRPLHWGSLHPAGADRARLDRAQRDRRAARRARAG